MPTSIIASEETRHRRIRVKVRDRALIVRVGSDRHSEQIGQLLPGAIVTVIEERVSKDGNVRGRIALDFMGKEDTNGRKTERGETFRSATGDTFRANATEPPELVSPSPSFRSDATSRAWSSTSSRKQAGQLGLSDLMQLSSIRSSFSLGSSNHSSYLSPQPVQGSSLQTPPSRLDPNDADSNRLGDFSHGYSERSNSASNSDRSSLWGVVRGAAGSLGGDSTSPAATRTNRPRTDNLGAIPEVNAGTPSPAVEAWSPLESTLAPELAFSPEAHLGFTAEELGYGARDDGSFAAFEAAVGAQHSRIQARWAMQLATDVAAENTNAPAEAAQLPHEAESHDELFQPTEDYLAAAGSQGSPRADPQQASYSSPSDEEGPHIGNASRTGWITLVKDGEKLVSSRLKLDANSRWQHQGMWVRRVGNHFKPGTTPQEEQLTPGRERKKLRLERQSDPNSFAFGGVYPGRLYAHGKLYDTHRVSYSIGVAGQYLLHVRLRNQAASLPGSPFTLQVHPGPAFALSTYMPPGPITGEVGTNITISLGTVDRMGNACYMGGSPVALECDNQAVETKVIDQNDGTYDLQWVVTQTGTFQTVVKIDGRQIINSPATLNVFSTVPSIPGCTFYPDQAGLKTGVVGVYSFISFRFHDQWGNDIVPTAEFRKTFKCGIIMLKDKERLHADRPQNSSELCEGKFIAEDDGGTSYEIKYVPLSAGHIELIAYALVDGNLSERHFFPDTPVTLLVSKNQVGDGDKNGRNANGGEINMSEMFLTAPQDYKIEIGVFEQAQKRWGECTIDGFASAATHLLPRYWTAKFEQASEHTDALCDPAKWKEGERIWAHPLPTQLLELTHLLDSPERCAEVLVCAPFWPRNGGDWFLNLQRLSDSSMRRAAGCLHKVADDAPDRVEEWPMIIFHIPGREKPIGRRRSTTGRPSSRSPSPEAERPPEPLDELGSGLAIPLAEPPPSVASSGISGSSTWATGKVANVPLLHQILEEQERGDD